MSSVKKEAVNKDDIIIDSMLKCLGSDGLGFALKVAPNILDGCSWDLIPDYLNGYEEILKSVERCSKDVPYFNINVYSVIGGSIIEYSYEGVGRELLRYGIIDRGDVERGIEERVLASGRICGALSGGCRRIGIYGIGGNRNVSLYGKVYPVFPVGMGLLDVSCRGVGLEKWKVIKDEKDKRDMLYKLLIYHSGECVFIEV